MTTGRARSRVALWSAAVLIAMAVLAAPLSLVVRALASADSSHPGLGAATSGTVRLALAVGASTLALGGGLGWALARAGRTDVGRTRHVAVALAASPLAAPPFAASLALDGQLDGFWRGVVALVVTTYPVVLLAVWCGLRGVGDEVDDAATVLAGRAGGATRVALGHVAPWAVGATALTMAMATADVGATLQAGYVSLATRAFAEASRGGARGAVVPAALLSLVASGPLVAAWFVRAARRDTGLAGFVLVDGAGAPLTKRRSGRLAAAAAGVPAAVGMTVSAAIVVRLATWAAGGSRGGNRFLPDVIGTSLGIATGAAIGAVGMAAVVAAAAAWRRSELAGLVVAVPAAAVGVPTIVVAVALTVAAGADGIHGRLLLGGVFAIGFLATAVGVMVPAATAARSEADDAARVLARRPMRPHRRAMARAALAAMALVSLAALREMPAALLVGPLGHPTLSALAYLAASFGTPALAARSALLLIGASAALLVLLGRRSLGLGRALP